MQQRSSVGNNGLRKVHVGRMAGEGASDFNGGGFLKVNVLVAHKNDNAMPNGGGLDKESSPVDVSLR